MQWMVQSMPETLTNKLTIMWGSERGKNASAIEYLPQIKITAKGSPPSNVNTSTTWTIENLDSINATLLDSQWTYYVSSINDIGTATKYQLNNNDSNLITSLWTVDDMYYGNPEDTYYASEVNNLVSSWKLMKYDSQDEKWYVCGSGKNVGFSKFYEDGGWASIIRPELETHNGVSIPETVMFKTNTNNTGHYLYSPAWECTNARSFMFVTYGSNSSFKIIIIPEGYGGLVWKNADEYPYGVFGIRGFEFTINFKKMHDKIVVLKNITCSKFKGQSPVPQQVDGGTIDYWPTWDWSPKYEDDSGYNWQLDLTLTPKIFLTAARWAIDKQLTTLDPITTFEQDENRPQAILNKNTCSWSQETQIITPTTKSINLETQYTVDKRVTHIEPNIKQISLLHFVNEESTDVKINEKAQLTITSSEGAFNFPTIYLQGKITVDNS